MTNLPLRILLTTLITLYVFCAHAKPGASNLIRLPQLIQNSKYIVIAVVNNVIDKKNNQISIPNYHAIAHLTVLHVLKGKSNHAIQVLYKAFTLCPPPIEFPNNDTIIGFLYKDDSLDVFYPMYGDYGSIVVKNEEELLTFKSRILEYMDILKQKKRVNLVTEWYTKCLESACTRRYVIQDLTEYKTKQGKIKKTFLSKKFYRKLNHDQKYRITQAILRVDSFSIDEILLMDYVPKKQYNNLKALLLKNLSFPIKSASHYMMMKKYIALFPDARLKAIFTEYRKVKMDDPKNAILIQEFLSVAQQKE